MQDIVSRTQINAQASRPLGIRIVDLKWTRPNALRVLCLVFCVIYVCSLFEFSNYKTGNKFQSLAFISIWLNQTMCSQMQSTYEISIKAKATSYERFSGCHFEYPMHIEYCYPVTSDISRIKYALILALN